MVLKVEKQMMRFTKLLRKVVDDTASKEVMEAVGNQAVEIIKRQARLGNDYKTGGKFKNLSDSYISKRNKYKSELDPRTRPKRSNVTATGQLIESLKLSDIRARSVEVEASGNRKGGSPFDSGKKTNAEVAYWVEYHGRHFLGLNDKTREQLTRFYKRIVDAVVRRSKINK